MPNYKKDLEEICYFYEFSRFEDSYKQYEIEKLQLLVEREMAENQLLKEINQENQTLCTF